MFNAEALIFQEFVMREPLPLAEIQTEVLEFLRDRDDAVVFGAQAVNAYVNEPRMTQDVALLSSNAPALVNELRENLHDRFNIAVRVRKIGKGRGYRLFQVRKSGNRHLVDIRPVEKLPPARRIDRVLVMTPVELTAYKVIAFHKRRGNPKSGTDWRDIAMLLLAYPELKCDPGPVTDSLNRMGVAPEILSVWTEFAKREISMPEEEDEF